MTDKEKEYFESYREINWAALIVWTIILVFSVFFGFWLVFQIGFVLGEYVIPFIQTLPIERMFWILVLFAFVSWVAFIYGKIRKWEQENEED